MRQIYEYGDEDEEWRRWTHIENLCCLKWKCCFLSGMIGYWLSYAIEFLGFFFFFLDFCVECSWSNDEINIVFFIFSRKEIKECDGEDEGNKWIFNQCQIDICQQWVNVFELN